MLLGLSSLTGIAHAESLQSSNFRFEESSIGISSLLESSSPNFKADTATGTVTGGNTSSGNFQVDAGPKTTNDPALSFIIENATASLGSFTPTAATMTTTSFSVINHTSYGYIVQVVGAPLKNGDHTISPMTTSGPSLPGTEQFGINLVANTQPESIGANPNQENFGQGVTAPNYATANEYRFVSGETLAYAPKSSGKTTFTISYLVNVEGLTPGGEYKSEQTLIVTGTY